MWNDDGYPAGAANDPNAPYNQPSPHEYDVRIFLDVYSGENYERMEQCEVPITIELYSDWEYADDEDIIDAIYEVLNKDPEWKGREDYEFVDYALIPEPQYNRRKALRNERRTAHG